MTTIPDFMKVLAIIMTTCLKCEHCNEMFEVSTEIAEAMHRWREASGEPFICGACAGVEEIHETETISVGASVFAGGFLVARNLK